MISIEQTKRDIAALQQEQFALYPLGDIQQLEQRVAIVGGQCRIRPALQGELQAAVEALEKARVAHARNAAINGEINQLQVQLSIAEAEARQRLIDEATNRMTSMRNEFNTMAKQICRHYEQMHRANLHYERTVPGYRSLRLPEFNFPMMIPMGWQGTTSDLIRQKSLPWLNAEQKEQS